jgi:metalloendopeptidase OMA1, mitochondrial
LIIKLKKKAGGLRACRPRQVPLVCSGGEMWYNNKKRYIPLGYQPCWRSGVTTMKKYFWIILTALVFVCPRGAAAQAVRTHAEIVEQAKAEVERVCGPIQKQMERPETFKQFQVLDEDVINAYADDNGNVAIYMGILNFLQSEDELATICGHEMTHLSAKHIKKSLGSTILATVVSEVLGGTAGNVAGNLIYTKNSRKHEREADRTGLLYMWRAGYDPYASIDVWEGMLRAGGSAGGLDKYLSTHPVDTERIENMKVMLYRLCHDGEVTTYCDEVIADKNLENMYNQFNAR